MRVVIHETGHALGLPDYYDYDSSMGPNGGVGGLDMMDANRGDHNGFSKWVLDWITPIPVIAGNHDLTLNASATSQDCVLIWPGVNAFEFQSSLQTFAGFWDSQRWLAGDFNGDGKDDLVNVYGAKQPNGQIATRAWVHLSTLNSPDLFAEYFMVQNRHRVGNDDAFGVPGDGMLIWHIDAHLDSSGKYFKYDNSFTDHKLLRLMEADGLEEIETGSGVADRDDYYTQGDAFGPTTTPSSAKYDGNQSQVEVVDFSGPGTQMSATFQVGQVE